MKDGCPAQKVILEQSCEKEKKKKLFRANIISTTLWM